jgi:cobalt/nickel transport system permease protein
VVVAAAFSLLIAVSNRFGVLGIGLALAVAGAFLARLPLLPVLKRLGGLNVFTACLWLVLPLTAGGSETVLVGPLAVSREGILLAARITLKANTIVLALTVLVSTLDLTTLGHALSHLRVPGKLVHLFLFTVRYIDVLHHEYARLRQAMKVRCFRAGMDRHTYRSVAYLVGMLLVKSLDRSERILAAMKCRGFRGRFYVLRHFAFAGRDAAFGVLSLVGLLALSWMTWA